MKRCNFAFVILLFCSSFSARAQEDKLPFFLNSTLSFGSENNSSGGPGLLFKNSLQIPMIKNVSVGPTFVLFHGIPNWSAEPGGKDNAYSAFILNIDLSYTTYFNADRNYVTVAGGAGGVNYHSLGPELVYTAYDFLGNPIRVTEYGKDEETRFNYHLNIEGGGKVSDRVSVGLSLDIYSYLIFGDLTTLGINARVRL